MIFFKDIIYKLIEVIQQDKLINKKNTIVLIGGLSRAGKSTFAKKVTAELETLQYKTKTVCLDNWILDFQERKPGMTVRERYKYQTIIDSLNNLVSLGETNWSKYDPKTKTHLDQVETITLLKDEILIIEGVVSLDIMQLRELASIKVFVQIEEMQRKNRFFQYYLSNNYDIKYVKNLYKERMVDEYPIIQNTIQFANLLIDPYIQFHDN